MFKAILAHILILATLTANFSQLGVYAGFELNKKYITAQLCINRDKPQLRCNGKCYLMRKVKQAEQKEKNRERENQRNLFQLAAVSDSISIEPRVAQYVKQYQFELPFYLPRYSAEIFQPPRI